MLGSEKAPCVVNVNTVPLLYTTFHIFRPPIGAMDHSPFAIEDELYKKLSISTATSALSYSSIQKFYLPGQPHI